MEDARVELGQIINETKFNNPICPIVQCVDGLPHTNTDDIRKNLIYHITHPVQWTSMVSNMKGLGVEEYYEVGPDDTLQKIVSRMCPDKTVKSILELPIYKEIFPQIIN
tara:strand:- start:285 stop:611 length:327 start_codon:yes stop_codon:yes gene_type:complete